MPDLLRVCKGFSLKQVNPFSGCLCKRARFAQHNPNIRRTTDKIRQPETPLPRFQAASCLRCTLRLGVAIPAVIIPLRHYIGFIHLIAFRHGLNAHQRGAFV